MPTSEHPHLPALNRIEMSVVVAIEQHTTLDEMALGPTSYVWALDGAARFRHLCQVLRDLAGEEALRAATDMPVVWERLKHENFEKQRAETRARWDRQIEEQEAARVQNRSNPRYVTVRASGNSIAEPDLVEYDDVDPDFD